jgi:hypothetical protein
MKPAHKECVEVFSKTARTATSTKTFACGSMGGLFFINCTAKTSSPSVVFTITGHDPVSNASYTILASAAITGTGLTVLRVHPELTAAANTIAKDFLPAGVSIVATHANGDSITYSVSFVGVQ